MTLDSFITMYNGTKVGDGQCVALIKKYEEEVLNITPEAIGNAHNYYDAYDTTPFLYNNFDKFTNNGTNIPQKGDIIVWNTNAGGGAGHVAIVYQNISNTSFTSFDQNWNTPLKCNIENHSYNNVSGWIRKKGTTPPTPQAEWIYKDAYLNQIEKENNATVIYNYLKGTYNLNNKTIGALLGNMDAESTLEPWLNERGGGGRLPAWFSGRQKVT